MCELLVQCKHGVKQKLGGLNTKKKKLREEYDTNPNNAVKQQTQFRANY